MARYYRFRKYSRRYRRKLWSSRIQNVSMDQSAAPNQNFFLFRNLATNPVQSEDTVSQKYTVKNIRIQFSVESAEAANISNVQVFIIYVPQGFTLAANTPYDHPEWIMASRLIGNPVTRSPTGINSYTISTRLARKLDTGDKISFMVIGENGNATSILSLRGLIRYNTKAN